MTWKPTSPREIAWAKLQEAEAAAKLQTTGLDLNGALDAAVHAIVDAVRGPKGDQGDKGDPGEPGQKGDTGVGLPGRTGETGPQGDTGADGARGQPGEQGPAGSQGQTGLTGPQGVKGDKGDTGDKGDPGERGPAGLGGGESYGGIPGMQVYRDGEGVGGPVRGLNFTGGSAITVERGIATVPVGAGAGGGLTVKEVDGAPSVTATTLRFPNSSVTDDGGGQATVVFPTSTGSTSHFENMIDTALDLSLNALATAAIVMRVMASAFTANRTLTLPSTSGIPSEAIWTITDTDGTLDPARKLHIIVDGSESIIDIDGVSALSLDLTVPYSTLILQSNFSGFWQVLSRSPLAVGDTDPTPPLADVLAAGDSAGGHDISHIGELVARTISIIPASDTTDSAVGFPTGVFDGHIWFDNALGRVSFESFGPSITGSAADPADEAALDQWTSLVLTATSGTFTLTVGSDTTAAIAFDAAVATVQSAMDTAIGAGNVVVTGTSLDDGLIFKFQGSLAAQHVSLLVDQTGLVNPAYTLSENIRGKPAGREVGVGSISLGSDGWWYRKTGANATDWVRFQAAFVEPTTATPEAIANALIAAGLMAAS